MKKRYCIFSFFFLLLYQNLGSNTALKSMGCWFNPGRYRNSGLPLPGSGFILENSFSIHRTQLFCWSQGVLNSPEVLEQWNKEEVLLRPGQDLTNTAAVARAEVLEKQRNKDNFESSIKTVWYVIYLSNKNIEKGIVWAGFVFFWQKLSRATIRYSDTTTTLFWFAWMCPTFWTGIFEEFIPKCARGVWSSLGCQWTSLVWRIPHPLQRFSWNSGQLHDDQSPEVRNSKLWSTFIVHLEQ